MNIGSRAILTCPPELAYGDQEAGDIPANSVLKFDVTILDAKAPGWKPAQKLQIGEPLPQYAEID